MNPPLLDLPPAEVESFEANLKWIVETDPHLSRPIFRNVEPDGTEAMRALTVQVYGDDLPWPEVAEPRVQADPEMSDLPCVRFLRTDSGMQKADIERWMYVLVYEVQIFTPGENDMDIERLFQALAFAFEPWGMDRVNEIRARFAPRQYGSILWERGAGTRRPIGSGPAGTAATAQLRYGIPLVAPPR